MLVNRWVTIGNDVFDSSLQDYGKFLSKMWRKRFINARIWNLTNLIASCQNHNDVKKRFPVRFKYMLAKIAQKCFRFGKFVSYQFGNVNKEEPNRWNFLFWSKKTHILPPNTPKSSKKDTKWRFLKHNAQIKILKNTGAGNVFVYFDRHAGIWQADTPKNTKTQNDSSTFFGNFERFERFLLFLWVAFELFWMSFLEQMVYFCIFEWSGMIRWNFWDLQAGWNSSKNIWTWQHKIFEFKAKIRIFKTSNHFPKITNYIITHLNS
jgi:hypothetical protein